VSPGDLLGGPLAGRSVRLQPDFFFGQALRAASPVGDFRLIDLIAVVIVRRETRSFADRAVNVYHAAAHSADQMVMVVANAVLEPCR
jgi:hypothetical protein